jgi:hypothetical protein
MSRNPFGKNKLTRCYETNTKEWKNYSKAKKTRFLPSAQGDQSQSDYRVGTSRGPAWL